MLMMSLLAMSVGVAGADIARPPCHSQIRADDMCYAAALPGTKAEAVKKPGTCLVCLAPSDSASDPARAASRIQAAFGAAVPADARHSVPWRPPQA